MALFASAALDAQTRTLRVRETVGLRRFSYPVRTRFLTGGNPLRLYENGTPVPAQFTPAGDGDIEMDFNVSLGPWEAREYTVREEKEVARDAPGEPMHVLEEDSSFIVQHPTGLAWEIPKNLLGLIKSVKTGRTSYLRPVSQGLIIHYKDAIESRIGDAGSKTTGHVTKEGPLACALRFESTEGLRGGRAAKSVVEMHFPRSKAWVEVLWTIEDPEHSAASMSADLELNIEGPPTLVDFGAGSMVYAALKKGQRAVLSAGAPQMGRPLWTIDLDGSPYASGWTPPADGWVHVMDQQRAVAAAMTDFAKTQQDSIDVSAGGRLRVRRNFIGGSGRTLRFWIHVVGMPVQVGAATSPQSMQSPLAVEWR